MSGSQAYLAEVPGGAGEGSNPPATATPASSGWRSVGFALTYFSYSTWKGLCLYLEDIYVEPAWRAHGLGMALIEQCVELAHSRGCQRVAWQALDWNTPAIAFYTQKLGASIMKEWLSLRLNSDDIQAFRRRFGKHANGANGTADRGAVQQQRVTEADMSTLS